MWNCGQKYAGKRPGLVMKIIRSIFLLIFWWKRRENGLYLAEFGLLLKVFLEFFHFLLLQLHLVLSLGGVEQRLDLLVQLPPGPVAELQELLDVALQHNQRHTKGENGTFSLRHHQTRQYQSINQSIHRTINPSNNPQSINQSIKQTTHQSID